MVGENPVRSVYFILVSSPHLKRYATQCAPISLSACEKLYAHISACMHIYASLHTYVHTSVRVCMHTSMYVCVFLHVHTYGCMHIYTRISAYKHVHVMFVSAYMYACLCVAVPLDIPELLIHVFRYACIHKYIYAYMHKQQLGMEWRDVPFPGTLAVSG